MTRLPGLDPAQERLVGEWLPNAELMADMSWGIVESTVLHVSAGDEQVVVKAGGPHNSHIAREISAYETVVPALAEQGAAPRLLHASREARILVTTHIHGRLVEDGPLESSAPVLHSAGELLALMHGMGSAVDETIERNLIRAALRWLDKPHRIPRSSADRARTVLESCVPKPVSVVPSHGDYSGRNWIVGDRLVVIDFGRFGYRPARQDFLRMHFRRWADHPAERELFFSGYGESAEAAGREWWVDVLREAIASAGWGYKVKDRAFEELGLRFTDAALEALAEH